MNRSTVVKNLIWRFLERMGAQTVTLLVSIILARILDPSAYGEIAIISVIITILQVFVDSGLGNALIQKKDADDIDFSSVFFFNLGFSLLLYCGLFFLAPIIAKYYNMSTLASPIRVLGIVVIVSGVKNTQQAYVSRHMLFKKFFFATLTGTILAAVVGIAMAYRGYGVWALVFQHLINTTIDTVILWFTVKWRPQKCFSKARLKVLFSYGWKLLVSQLITVTYSNVRQLIIGKKYDSSALAFYNRGDQIPGLIVKNINSSIDSVLFPTLSSAQESKEAVKSMTKRAIRTSSFIMMLMMMTLAMCAEPLVRIVLTEKWMPCIPFLRIFCVVYAFYPIHTSNLNAIMASGRSDLSLKLEIIKVAMGLVILLLTYRISAFALAVGYLVSTLISLVINAWPNKKLINYPFFEQILDIMPAALIAILSGAVMFLIGLLPWPDVVKLIAQLIAGMGVYVLISRVSKLDSYFYIIDAIRKLTKRNGENKHD